MPTSGQSAIMVIDAYRTLAFGSITSSFVAVGTPFLHMLRAFRIVNTSNTDMIFSTDGATSMLYVPAGTFVLYDISTNRETACNFYLPYGTQFYVKYVSGPASGAVYVEGFYGQGE